MAFDVTAAPARTIDKLAFIGFGEAGLAFVKGFGPSWAAITWAYDLKTDSADADIRDAKWADYARAGVTGCASVAAALQDADVVFSVVTADQALAAATAAAPHLRADALYLDCNSCSPETKREAARLIENASARYVDAAVMSPVHPALHKAPILLSGPNAEDALAATRRLDMNATIAEGPVGHASSIKMMRSIMIKGLEALVLECVLAGRKAGVEDVVLQSLDASFPGFGWKTRAAYMMERVMTHGLRRAAEMREVARTVDELGLRGRMSDAITDWQQQIGELGVKAASDDYAALADALLRRLDPVKEDA